MSKGRVISTNIRFDMERAADRTAWDYLQRRDKREHRSYSRAVIAAVNDYFERRDRLASDPYLETREKEDAFLLRVLETVRAGLNQGASPHAADTLLQLLQVIQTQPAPVEQVSQEGQREADDMALDFVDGF